VKALWAKLPLVGAPLAEFTVGQGEVALSRAGFIALITAAEVANGAIPETDEAFQDAERDLHAKMAALEDFATAALEQGRSQYAEGSPDREIIDSIPHATGGGGGTTGGGDPVTPLEIANLSYQSNGSVMTVTAATTGGDNATAFTLIHRIEGGAEVRVPLVRPAMDVSLAGISGVVTYWQIEAANGAVTALSAELSYYVD
jgi:hypothetical protein